MYFVNFKFFLHFLEIQYMPDWTMWSKVFQIMFEFFFFLRNTFLDDPLSLGKGFLWTTYTIYLSATVVGIHFPISPLQANEEIILAEIQSSHKDSFCRQRSKSQICLAKVRLSRDKEIRKIIILLLTVGVTLTYILPVKEILRF